MAKDVENNFQLDSLNFLRQFVEKITRKFIFFKKNLSSRLLNPEHLNFNLENFNFQFTNKELITVLDHKTS